MCHLLRSNPRIPLSGNISLIIIPNFTPQIRSKTKHSIFFCHFLLLCVERLLNIPFHLPIHNLHKCCPIYFNTVLDISCLSLIKWLIFAGKDSPSSKLLFAKDIPLYRQLVVNFYQNIQNLPQVNICTAAPR